MDFERARTNMVECQIMPNGVTNHDVLRAFLNVPREAFVPSAQRPHAYIDEDIEVAPGRYVMEAMTMAKLVQLCGLEPTSIVLDIGCATGYSTAILAQLSASVVALEEDESLAAQASEHLIEADITNAAVVTGPLNKGYAQEAPYDVIFLNGAVDVLPDTLGEQLKDGGRMVVVYGQGNAAQARLLTRHGDRLGRTNAFNCAVEPLPGFQQEAAFVF
ncbi:MAG: protein-L-isoaspartate O-methyltransferase [Pseudomonadota bacterium]